MPYLNRLPSSPKAEVRADLLVEVELEAYLLEYLDALDMLPLVGELERGTRRPGGPPVNGAQGAASHPPAARSRLGKWPREEVEAPSSVAEAAPEALLNAWPGRKAEAPLHGL